ncbi:MAG: hypothetical protein C7B45_06830 [Sulfobacillus acidophilus]|uniref:Glycoside hydrolase family 57 N-terminal domain-containing protein n=1 Tax=Sulfobacillus acidophilus TaxID=53633 RepID=A0A2T2WJL2_9FIRM|nr:MAG: hypothetical protein C7B45_06830 [Sulfobacillus acidophilus]
MSTSLSIAWPFDQLPIYLIVDDGAPLLNLDHWEQPNEDHVAVIPNEFLRQFIHGVQERGVRGKFTVLPYPMGLGAIDQSLPGVSPQLLQEFLQLVRDELEPWFDITPEILTHLNALDAYHDWLPLPFSEKRMISYHTEDSLILYFRRALQILNQAGLHPKGMTSPGTFGIEAEERYVSALAQAFRQETDVEVPFYYLHTDPLSLNIPPRLHAADPLQVVHVSSGHGDPLWPTKYGRPSTIDALLDANGQSGRIQQLVLHRSPIGFHTHWSSLYSDGSAVGLQELWRLIDRITAHYGNDIRWIRCSDLVQYVARVANVTVTTQESISELTVTLTSSQPVADFTLYLSKEPILVRLNGRILTRTDRPRAEGWWSARGHSVITWHLKPSQAELVVQFESR